jgi:hypothetical protein|tara:strand:- start:626 stop:916 length:291 start_codon:yes stop_codon:yes gene_type:complete
MASYLAAKLEWLQMSRDTLWFGLAGLVCASLAVFARIPDILNPLWWVTPPNIENLEVLDDLLQPIFLLQSIITFGIICVVARFLICGVLKLFFLKT